MKISSFLAQQSSSFPFFSLWTQSSLPWKCHSFAKNEPPSVFLKNFRHSLFVGIPIYIRSPVSCGGAGYCIGHPAGGLSATYGCFVAPKHLTEGSNRRGLELSILSRFPLIFIQYLSMFPQYNVVLYFSVAWMMKYISSQIITESQIWIEIT